MRAIAAGLSDVGLQREHNEDSFVVLNEYDLYIVADGMGGHRAGDVAIEARHRDHQRVLQVDRQRRRDLAVPLRHQPLGRREPPPHRHPRRQPPDLRAKRQARANTTAWARRWSAPCSARRRTACTSATSATSRCYRVRARRAAADDARPLAHQRLPDGDARPHRGAAERAPEERHHPRARECRTRSWSTCSTTSRSPATSTCSAPTASRA